MKYLLIGVDYDYDTHTNLGLYLFDDEIPFICNSVYKDGDTIYIDKRYDYVDAEHQLFNDKETASVFSETYKDIELIYICINHISIMWILGLKFSLHQIL